MATAEPPIIHCPEHTKAAFDVRTFPDIVEWAQALCAGLEADAIAACGHSGLTVAGAVSYCLNIPVFAVRKPGEPSVARSEPVSAVTKHGPAKRWVWLDDCICSGGTFANAITKLRTAKVIAERVPIAALLYDRRKVSYFAKTREDGAIQEEFLPTRLLEVLPAYAKLWVYGYRD